MIRRKAIIVSAPREIGGGFGVLDGVSKDLQRYRDFLLSDHGGAWRHDEIVAMEEPEEDELRRVLEKAGRTADFAITILSGHGRVDRDAPLFINPWRSIRSVEDFRTGAARELTICDTCRAMEPQRRVAEHRMRSIDLLPPPDSYRQACRMMFDEAVVTAVPFREIMWACSVGETAADTTDGGLFSTNLVGRALVWASRVKRAYCYDGGGGSVLSAHSAFAIASRLVARVNTPTRTQTPDISTHRGTRKLPFAVA
jgi:hypothetical protein